MFLFCRYSLQELNLHKARTLRRGKSQKFTGAPRARQPRHRCTLLVEGARAIIVIGLHLILLASLHGQVTFIVMLTYNSTRIFQNTFTNSKIFALLKVTSFGRSIKPSLDIFTIKSRSKNLYFMWD